MHDGKILILLFLFPIGLACCSSETNSSVKKFVEEKLSPSPEEAALPFKAGETIKYAIKSFGMKAGEATLTFAGLQNLNGTKVYLIVFAARSVNFFDEEKIYADAKTFYPLRVERDLNIWGKKEKITEEYDQASGIIKINKHASSDPLAQTIAKKGPIDNIYCFIYRYRMSGQFKIGDSFAIHLPTRNVTIGLVKMVTVEAADKKFPAYFMQSIPAKYKLWFDTSMQKIPLKINGAVGINDTAMIMTEYKEGNK